MGPGMREALGYHWLAECVMGGVSQTLGDTACLPVICHGTRIWVYWQV